MKNHHLSWLPVLLLLAIISIANIAIADSALKNQQVLELQVKTLNLRYRSATAFLPIIKPILPTGSSISADGNILIIKSTPAGLQEAQQIVKKIDKKSMVLVISIRKTHRSDQFQSKRHQIVETQDRENRDQMQRITVLDGESALIRNGEAIPIHNYSWNTEGFSSHTEYKKIDNGYVITPRVQGKQIAVQIEYKSNRLLDDRSRALRRHSAIEREQTQTILTVPFGYWFKLSQDSIDSMKQRRHQVYDTAGLKDPDTELYLKIDKASN